ncbi:ATP-binding protein, partial [Pseudomonas aeruginosa]
RTTITAFINLLAVLEQNPGTDWRSLLGAVEIAPDRGGEADTQVDADDELATFQL